jgi:hypothetical protein
VSHVGAVKKPTLLFDTNGSWVHIFKGDAGQSEATLNMLQCKCQCSCSHRLLVCLANARLGARLLHLDSALEDDELAPGGQSNGVRPNDVTLTNTRAKFMNSDSAEFEFKAGL